MSKRIIFLIIGIFILILISNVNAVECNIDSIKQYALKQGFDEISLEVLDSDKVELFSGKEFFFVKLSDKNKEAKYYVDCETGIVYDHQPSLNEVYQSGKITQDLFWMLQEGNGEFNILVKAKKSINIAQAKEQLKNIGMDVYNVRELEIIIFEGMANKAEIEEIAKLEWVDEIGANLKLFVSSKNDKKNIVLILNLVALLFLIIFIILIINKFRKKGKT